MSDGRPTADADGWYAVPHAEQPIDYRDLDRPPNGEDPAAYYNRFWIPEVRMPQRIQELEFIDSLQDDMDVDGSIEDYDFRSVWYITNTSDDVYDDDYVKFQEHYKKVRSPDSLSLGNARMFEITLPERRARGEPQSFLQLWLDCSKPLLDSVFFNTNLKREGVQCLVVRRVTHVRFCTANGMPDPSEYPRDATGNPAVQDGEFDGDALNYPSYVLQWGSLKDFLRYRPNSLTTIFLNEAGVDFDNIEDPKHINDANVHVKTPFTYYGADTRIKTVNRFTLDTEQSLLPQTPAAVLKAIRAGKRWSKNFTHRYYRPGGRGALKEKQAFESEGLAGPSSSSEAGPSSAGQEPALKRERSPSQIFPMWKGSERGPKEPKR